MQIFSANVGVKNTQIRPEIAIYNANPVLTQLTVFGPTLGNVSSILNPRVVRLGSTIQF